VHSDIAEATDKGSIIALIMLYLSAAFDVVIYHPILLKYLEFFLQLLYVYTKPVGEIIIQHNIK